jgi:hypothetical protein
MDDDGGVGLAVLCRDAISARCATNYYLATRQAGCPTASNWVAKGCAGDAYNAQILAVPGGTVDPWRVVTSHSQVGFVPPTYFWLEDFPPDGGRNVTGYITDGYDQYDVAAALSFDGSRALAAYLFVPDAGPPKQYEIDALSFDTVGTVTSPQPVTLFPGLPAYWNTSDCGSGCMAVSYLPGTNRGNLSVAFTSDDGSLTSKGTYDVACDQPLAGAGTAVTALGTKLAVPFLTPSSLVLYLCDRPF